MAKKKPRPSQFLTTRAPDALREIGLPYPEELAHAPAASTLVGLYAEAAARFILPISGRLTEGSLREGTLRILRYLDELLASHPTAVHFDGIGRRSIACRSGCNHCCTLRVTCTAPTILLIADYLRRELSDEQLDALLARIAAHEAALADCSPLAAALKTEMCPLNAEGRCMAYTVRPTGCRSYHSFDLQKCIEDRQQPGKDPEVLSDLRRKSLEGVVVLALDACCGCLNLDTKELEFVTALQIALTEPDFASRYLAGEDVFACAHRPDITRAHRAERDSRLLKPLPQRT